MANEDPGRPHSGSADRRLQVRADGLRAGRERWEYNNSGYVLLGAVIEKASGKTYADFVVDRIFKPLGMKATAYGAEGPILPKRAAGYTRDGETVFNARYLSMSQPYSAGALVSTVDDLALWDAALYTEKLVKKASFEKAWTPAVTRDGKATQLRIRMGNLDPARRPRHRARRRDLRLLDVRHPAPGREGLRRRPRQQRQPEGRPGDAREEDRSPPDRQAVPGAGRRRRRPEGPGALDRRLPLRPADDADGDRRGGEALLAARGRTRVSR